MCIFFPLLSLLNTLHLETTRARDVLREAEKKLNDIKREKEKAEEELSRLSDPTWYGPQGEWKKLAGTCLEKDTGE